MNATLFPDTLPRLGDWHSFEELLRLQAEYLPGAIERARTSAFYASRIARRAVPGNVAELSRLPLTTKADLRAAYPYGLLAVPMEEVATYHESSGTTGHRSAGFYTEQDWADLLSRYVRNAVDLGPSDIVMVRTPYSMMTTSHLAQLGARSRGATVVPADNLTRMMTYHRTVELMRNVAVTVAWSLPTECVRWAAAARLAGYRTETDFPSLRAFFVAGEPLPASKRARLSEIWGGAEVYEDYGATELGSLAGQCPQGTLHLWADRFVPEVLDPQTGRSAREGTGQLVITTLWQRAMPVVRYNIEDFVEVSYADCPCGWLLPSLRVTGRPSSELVVGRTRVSQGQLDELVFGLPAEYSVLFWRARRIGDGLRIEIEVGKEHEAKATTDLERAVAERLGVGCRVDGVAPGTLMPERLLRPASRSAKPRALFDQDEDWDAAIVQF